MYRPWGVMAALPAKAKVRSWQIMELLRRPWEHLIRSSMEVVALGKTDGPEKIPVWIDKNAMSADGIIAVNRVKPHTDFHSDYESGIVKMLTIGLGKQAQAMTVHRYGADGLRDYIPVIAKKND